MKDIKLLKKFGFTTVSLVLFVFLLNWLIVTFYDIGNDIKANIFISVISIAATLSAPLAAYLFYDNWKAQTKFNRVTSNLLELQKILHDYVTELKFLRHRIIFPHLRSKFLNKEEDYIDNLKKLLDKKVSEITIAERLKYDSYKILSVIRTDTQGISNTLDNNLNEIDNLISRIYLDIQEFKHNYFVFINNYYKDEEDLKNFMKTDEYKNLTYKISTTRETNNVIKTNLKLALTLEENLISPEKTLKIQKFIQDIDLILISALKDYETNFKN